ncbi:MAG: hypothetical protein KIH69_012020 [Anaerolineae bacterium]|nr:hypothetical protein [Anaerolineae bacterium]
MIYLIVVWLLLIGVGYVIGAGVCRLCGAVFSSRLGDQFIYHTWLGLLVLSMVFLFVVLLVPLTPWVGGAVCGGLLLAASRFDKWRAGLVQLWRAVPIWIWLAFPVLIIGVAAFNVKYVMLIDAGGYHIPLINWFSSYGAPPGLGLLHPRYGYTSSWFALFAPLNHGIFENRIMSVPGGLALLLLLTHLGIVGRRILQNDAKPSDFFIAISSLIVLACINLNNIKFQGGFVRSTSPDVPIFVLMPLVVWVFLVISEQNQTWRGVHYIALVLLCAALINIKLSAGAVVALVGLALMTQKAFDLALLIKLALLGILLVVPSLAYATIVTGCPIYPLPLCLDLPWSLGTAQASAESDIIRIWARWGWWHGPSADTPIAQQISQWARGEPLAEQFVYVNIACLIFLAALLIIQRYQARPAKTTNTRSLIIIGVYSLISMVFWAYSAPTLRFGLGTLVILPALVGAQCLAKIKFVRANMAWLSPPNFGNLGVSAFFIVVGLVFLMQGLNVQPNGPDALIRAAMQRGDIAPEVAPNWLLPPKIANGVIAYRPQIRQTLFLAQGLHRYEVNDVRYSTAMPDTEDGTAINQCWALDLMCTARLGNDQIRLRDATRGIRAGFVLAKP